MTVHAVERSARTPKVRPRHGFISCTAVSAAAMAGTSTASGTPGPCSPHWFQSSGTHDGSASISASQPATAISASAATWRITLAPR